MPSNMAATSWWKANREAAAACWRAVRGAGAVPAPVRCSPLDCRMFPHDGAEMLLFGERSTTAVTRQSNSANSAWPMGGGLLLLHAESLPLKTQRRLAQYP